MAKRLTDKDKKKIIADYMENQNYSETARINNVGVNTVKRLVLSQDNEEMARKSKEKKEENTKDILEYMDNIAEKQKKIIDLSLEVLEEKLANPDLFTNIRDVAIVYGTIFDKALKYKELQVKNGDNNKNNFADSLVELWKEREKNEK